MEEKEVLVTDNVTEKKKMNPTKKKITIAGVIVGIIAVIAILIGVNHTAIMSDITYSFMPKSITPDFSGTKVEFYKYKNKDYNQFKDKNKPLKAFGFYYIDENGKKQDLSWDGVYICLLYTSKDIDSVTTMLSKGMTPDDIAKRAMQGIEIEKLDESTCRCV